jgi:glycosyltransferase involved in cell wall biosynthesis
MQSASEPGITASVAFYGARAFIRRAVESLLSQTHRNLTIVVVSDGDPYPPWNELAHIRDPRLIRFGLAQNQGPYFAHQVVLGASITPYFMIQDADDWSSPSRVKTLLGALVADGSDLAFSAWQQYRVDANGVLHPDEIRWHRKRPGSRPSNGHSSTEPFLFDPVLTDAFINRASHHGIFRRQALEKLGGYYAGFRMNHDTLLTNLLLMTGRVSFVETPHYNYLLRPDSLSHSPATGSRSEARRLVKQQQTSIYQEALRHYRAWLSQKQSSAELQHRIHALAQSHITSEARSSLNAETARLAAILRSNSRY